MWGRASSPERSSARYLARRRLRRRRIFFAAIVFLCSLLGSILFILQQNFVRISQVTISGADQSLADIATSLMRGDYLGIIPRDSIFFFPAARIRSDIIATQPTIAAVSISREGLTSLSIRVDYRAPVARWCGSGRGTTTEAIAGLPSSGNCYFFDASGVLYASATDQKTIHPFVVFTSLPGPILIGSTLPHAEQLPVTFDVARKVSTYGTSVVSINIGQDEVTLTLASGTRIMYLLGIEETAVTALISARRYMNLADGSIEYIDLRFPGTVYVKKVITAP